MAERNYFQPKRNEILSRFHILEYLRRNERARQDELAVELGKHPRHIYSVLKKLMAREWVKRKKEKHNNRKTYYYYLTKEAERWRIRSGLPSYLDPRNIHLPLLKKVVQYYSNPRGAKIGGKYRVVPRKELKGFR